MQARNRSPAAVGGRAGTVLVVFLAIVLVVLAIVLPRDVVESVLGAVGFEQEIPERHVVPVGREGWLVVHYGMHGQPALPPDRRIWEERDVALGGESEHDPVQRLSAFFVSTREASRDAEAAWLQVVGP